MEALKKYKIPLLIILPIAFGFIIYNNFIKKKTPDEYDQYSQEQYQTAPVDPVSQAGPPPSYPVGISTPGQTVTVRTNTRKLAEGEYEEIIKEIYTEYETQMVRNADIRNIFVDFKLSSEMNRKARETIFTVENELKNYESLVSSGSLLNIAENVSEARNYLKYSREALADKNYLKSELYGRKALVELEKIENQEKSSAYATEKKGPTVTHYYKGFISKSGKKTAFIKEVVTYSDIVGGERATILMLSVGDTIDRNGEMFKIKEIRDDEVILEHAENQNMRTSITIDQKY